MGTDLELSETFHWEGRDIAYGRAGNGPAVIFCHGTPFSSRVWRPFAQALARDYTVHVRDMPVCGRSSERAEDPLAFTAQAGALAALVQHWGLDRPHVVAHDFGGAVSLRA